MSAKRLIDTLYLVVMTNFMNLSFIHSYGHQFINKSRVSFIVPSVTTIFAAELICSEKLCEFSAPNWDLEHPIIKGSKPKKSLFLWERSQHPQSWHKDWSDLMDSFTAWHCLLIIAFKFIVEPDWSWGQLKVFNDDQCTNLGGYDNLGNNDCKKKCLSVSACTAINWNRGSKKCYLRGCPQPVQKPQWRLGNNWFGYALLKKRVRNTNILFQLFNSHVLYLVKISVHVLKILQSWQFLKTSMQY